MDNGIYYILMPLSLLAYCFIHALRYWLDLLSPDLLLVVSTLLSFFSLPFFFFWNSLISLSISPYPSFRAWKQSDSWKLDSVMMVGWVYFVLFILFPLLYCLLFNCNKTAACSQSVKCYKAGKLRKEEPLEFLKRSLLLVEYFNSILKAYQSDSPTQLIPSIIKAELLCISLSYLFHYKFKEYFLNWFQLSSLTV